MEKIGEFSQWVKSNPFADENTAKEKWKELEEKQSHDWRVPFEKWKAELSWELDGVFIWKAFNAFQNYGYAVKHIV